MTNFTPQELLAASATIAAGMLTNPEQYAGIQWQQTIITESVTIAIGLAQEIIHRAEELS